MTDTRDQIQDQIMKLQEQLLIMKIKEESEPKIEGYRNQKKELFGLRRQIYNK